MTPRIVVAFLVIGVLIGLVVALDWRDRRRTTGDRDQPTPILRDQEYPKENQRRAAEMHYWRWQNRLGAGALVFAAGAVIAAAFTWHATQGQLEELRSEQRPGVYADVVPSGPIVRNIAGGYTIQVAFVVHNTGHLPAMYVWPAAGGMVQPSVSQLVDGQNFACRQRDAVPYQIGTNGNTVFPGQTLTLPQGVGIDKATLDEVLTLNKAVRVPGASATITGCIDYQVPGDAKHHHTRLAYNVGQKIDNDPTGMRSLPDDPTSVPVIALSSRVGRWAAPPLLISQCASPVMRAEPLSNGQKPTDEQLRAAIAAAPYLHPRLATTTLNATVAGRPQPPFDPEKLPPHLRGPLEEIMLWCDAQHRSGAS
jgi:hypothetical protein